MNPSNQSLELSSNKKTSRWTLPVSANLIHILFYPISVGVFVFAVVVVVVIVTLPTLELI